MLQRGRAWGVGFVPCLGEHPVPNRDLKEDSAVPSNLSIPKVLEQDVAAISACAKSGPKSGDHVQLFRTKRDCNKGFYSEKC